MKKLTTLMLVVLLGLTFTRCHTDKGTNPDINPPRDLSTVEKALVQSGNTFGFDLFTRLATTRPDSNLFVSPLSISIALGMAYNGAAGTTAEAMRTVLGFSGMDTGQINQGYRDLIDLLRGLDEDVVMEIANSSWARQDFALQPAFVDALATYFDAEAQSLNFSDPASVDIINGWIEEKTHDKIQDMLTEIDPATVLFLINALYFKAPWTTEFDPEKTVDGLFTLEDGSQVDCKLMSLHEKFQYGVIDGVQVLDLPYGNGQYSMTLIKPQSGRLADVLAVFDQAHWDAWMAGLTETELDLLLPRFKVEDDWELKEVLKAMGMAVAFGGGADFSGINPNYELYISQVLHRTFVEVTEEGTEAAAVTVVDIRETSVSPSMQLDSPFLFVIRDHHSGTLMFMGMIINPAQGQ